jgi:ABC-2 type transport system permease protein
MTGAVLRALFLELVRDRGALVMAFVLPVVFFLVFAWIFAGTGGGDLVIRLAVADTVDDDDSRTLLEALAGDAAISVVARGDADAVREAVRRGGADAGLIVRSRLRADADAPAEPPLVLCFDPTKAVAVSMLAGRVQRAYVQALPDVALTEVVTALDRRFLQLTQAQQDRLELGMRALRENGTADDQDPFGALYVQEPVVGRRDDVNLIAYYAGAVAMLFVLFSAVHGAISLLDERDAGIIDRVLAGPAGIRVLVRARFLFLSIQSFVQVAIIFVVAWLGYGVDLPGNLGGWAITSVAVSMSAAGLALAIVTACQSRRQAQAVSNFAILIVSAIGGSMVPRFFMPPLLRKLGWLTPNTWGLEAYTSVFWRGDSLDALVLPLALLVASGLVGLAVAQGLARRWERL